MKKLLLGLTLLASMSSFASTSCKVLTEKKDVQTGIVLMLKLENLNKDKFVIGVSGSSIGLIKQSEKVSMMLSAISASGSYIEEIEIFKDDSINGSSKSYTIVARPNGTNNITDGFAFHPRAEVLPKNILSYLEDYCE